MITQVCTISTSHILLSSVSRSCKSSRNDGFSTTCGSLIQNRTLAEQDVNIDIVWLSFLDDHTLKSTLTMLQIELFSLSINHLPTIFRLSSIFLIRNVNHLSQQFWQIQPDLYYRSWIQTILFWHLHYDLTFLSCSDCKLIL